MMLAAANMQATLLQQQMQAQGRGTAPPPHTQGMPGPAQVQPSAPQQQGSGMAQQPASSGPPPAAPQAVPEAPQSSQQQAPPVKAEAPSGPVNKEGGSTNPSAPGQPDALTDFSHVFEDQFAAAGGARGDGPGTNAASMEEFLDYFFAKVRVWQEVAM